ncbi:type II secretion system protein GspD [Adhaeribacter soli]|uniref:type II secretion system protein GspD n=1 Tax=Adhaeribacter soli TaxID=2607655 RepID=UPI0017809FF3|nr:general secretion pathway protein GspD [Adhaeribacter soli]
MRLNYNREGDLFTADLSQDSLRAFAKQATQLTKRNIILASGLQDKLITGYVEGMPLDAALDRLAYANNLVLFRSEKDGAFILQEGGKAADQGNNQFNRNSYQAAGGSSGISALNISNGKNGKKLIELDAVNVPITDLINEISNKAAVGFMLFSPIQGNTTTKVKDVSYEELLSFLLQGTTHTYKQSENVFLIGSRNSEGFRSTRVFKMHYRPAEKLDEIIPVELKKGIEIKVFNELNSLILSGGAQQIEEITDFLKAIDEPVKNVLIEVMVVELRRGHTVKTGIKAGLGDSAVATSGQVFPALDMTIGSKGINDFLEKLNAKGWINIGKVTPNFYMTLQALENNNHIDIRSTPKLSTLNGHEAKLTIGQTVYYQEQNQVITGGVTPITSVTQQFKQVSADLNIKINPMVSGDEHITLKIDAEFSDFIPATIQGAPPGNTTRQFTSMIRVRNEEMIVLGGLEEVSRSKSGSGVPILSRIPILRWLFSSRSDEKRKNKLVVFIKPTLLY